MTCTYCGGSGVTETELYEGLVNCPVCVGEPMPIHQLPSDKIAVYHHTENGCDKGLVEIPCKKTVFDVANGVFTSEYPNEDQVNAALGVEYRWHGDIENVLYSTEKEAGINPVHKLKFVDYKE